ncbi:hypothetical protein, partial [Alteromonas sp. AMM-1]|uniref:hypothetical protein n=1 Tax=Alteromonas sp. AMM-1 TaxID=3394233 RepID=UPI0039A3FE90
DPRLRGDDGLRLSGDDTPLQSPRTLLKQCTNAKQDPRLRGDDDEENAGTTVVKRGMSPLPVTPGSIRGLPKQRADAKQDPRLRGDDDKENSGMTV